MELFATERRESLEEKVYEGTLFTKEVEQDGKKVRIEVQASESGKWLLRIVGKRGQLTEWTELYTTPLEAFSIALGAIKYEGIDEFYDDPVFAYLYTEVLLKPP